MKSLKESKKSRAFGAVIETLFPSDKDIKLSFSTAERRRSDADWIMNGNLLHTLVKYEGRRQMKSDEVIEDAVNFILLPDHIQTVAYGSRIVKLDVQEKHIIPN